MGLEWMILKYLLLIKRVIEEEFEYIRSSYLSIPGRLVKIFNSRGGHIVTKHSRYIY